MTNKTADFSREKKESLNLKRSQLGLSGLKSKENKEWSNNGRNTNRTKKTCETPPSVPRPIGKR